MIIAVDANGGDYAPRELVKGAVEAAEEYKVDIALVGRKTILDMLVRHYASRPSFTIIEASQTIEPNEHPVQAIRSKPDSSIVVGTKLVRDSIASAFVSAGNTGAILTAAFLNLKKMEGIQRPALCGLIHVNAANPVLLIDAGANVDCQPSFLVQFAQLGTIFAKGFLGINSPRVGLLSNGEEEIKGNLLTRDSYQLLKKTELNFIGNVEGQEMLKGKADVIVTDGFTGNIVLKTMEGFGDTFQNLLGVGQVFRVDHQLQGPALAHYVELGSTVKRMDYKEYGGACLLGINGNIVIAHGRSQAKAIKNAIHLAHRAAHLTPIEAIKNGYHLSN
ncbi:MAG TPA: phosphate acyltransferase PlsX [Dehalococcoidia bacterium]|nr:phosphate acyltransferase PlsX [Dehalococcoidia bacterium]